MAWLDRFRRARTTSPTPRADLFDKDFQRRLDYLAVVSRRLFSGQLRADRRTRRTGSGIEFADHRDYAPGDDLRYLDWSVYGRSEKLLLKLFEEEEDLTVYLLVDCSGSMGFGPRRKLDHALRLAAALAYVSLANLDRVGLIGFSSSASRRLAPGRGRGRIFKVFEFLRSLEASGETSLANAARSLGAENKRRGVAIILSDLYDPAGFERGLNAVRYQRFEPMIVHLTDPADADPRDRGDVTLVDSETGDSREVTLSAELIARYKNTHTAWREEILGVCRSRQVPFVTADVTEPFEDQVLELFRRAGLVG